MEGLREDKSLRRDGVVSLWEGLQCSVQRGFAIRLGIQISRLARTSSPLRIAVLNKESMASPEVSG